MAQGYTPGLTVTDSALIRKQRRLPLPGEVLVEVGQQVEAQQVVAQTKLPGNVAAINVAHELNIPPEEVPTATLVAAGDHVEAGDVLAQLRALWGVFQSTATSPIAGTVESISGVTGQLLLRGHPLPVQVRAYLAGTVVEVAEGQGATIETRGALLQGIIGLGREAYGQLFRLVSRPEEVLEAEAITDEARGKVIVGGALVGYEALERAMAVGAAGVVSGGISDTDIDRFLGYPLGVAITGQEDQPLTLVITEGFGRIPMSDRAFELLSDYEGHAASINGATQIRAGVIRPEVIIAHGHAPEGATARGRETGLTVGGLIRLVRDPYFGLLGEVVELPEQPQVIETEAQVRVLRARLRDGREVLVPRANVELIQT